MSRISTRFFYFMSDERHVKLCAKNKHDFLANTSNEISSD